MMERAKVDSTLTEAGGELAETAKNELGGLDSIKTAGLMFKSLQANSELDVKSLFKLGENVVSDVTAKAESLDDQRRTALESQAQTFLPVIDELKNSV